MCPGSSFLQQFCSCSNTPSPANPATRHRHAVVAVLSTVRLALLNQPAISHFQRVLRRVAADLCVIAEPPRARAAAVGEGRRCRERALQHLQRRVTLREPRSARGRAVHGRGGYPAVGRGVEGDISRVGRKGVGAARWLGAKRRVGAGAVPGHHDVWRLARHCGGGEPCSSSCMPGRGGPWYLACQVVKYSGKWWW